MKRSTLFVMGAALVVALGLGALVTMTTTPPSGRSLAEPSARAPSSPSTDDSSRGPSASLGCAPAALAQATDTTSPPGDLRWVTAAEASWPVSATAGPTGARDGLPACFERSDRGAALAAATILFAQVDHSPLQTWATYAAATPGKQVLLGALNGHSESAVQDDVTTSGTEAAGYRVDSSSLDRVELTLALRLPGSPDLTGWPVVLVWNESDTIGGDWLVRIRDDGAIGDPVSLEPDDIVAWVD